MRGAVGRGQGALDAFVIRLRAVDREGDLVVGAPEMETRGHIDLPRPAAEGLLGVLGLARAANFFRIEQVLTGGPRILIETALQGLQARAHAHVTRELALDLDDHAGGAFAETGVGAVKIEIGERPVGLDDFGGSRGPIFKDAGGGVTGAFVVIELEHRAPRAVKFPDDGGIISAVPAVRVGLGAAFLIPRQRDAIPGAFRDELPAVI